MNQEPKTEFSIPLLQPATAEDIKTAFKVASEAFCEWNQVSRSKKRMHLRKLRDVVAGNIERIIEEINSTIRKVPFDILTGDIVCSLENIKYIENNLKVLECKKMKTPFYYKKTSSYIYYKPYGKVLIISPWNYPFQLSVIPAVTAIAAGNTVIHKPSEISSKVGLLIQSLFDMAGFPKGVFQTIVGDGTIGENLIEKRPDKIFFTGSGSTGKKILEQASKHLIPVDIELGGNDPMIVFSDSDINRALNGVLFGAFLNAGQVCVGTKRVYVEENIYEVFCGKLAEKIKCIRIGTSYDADMGPLVLSKEITLIEDQVKDALEKGAVLLTPLKKDNLYHHPVILKNVNHKMRLMREETFGPLIGIMPFKTEEEALSFANDSEFGLSGSVWSSNLKKAKRIAEKVESGTVAVNHVITNIANPYMPFGGVKKSGFGRYHGKEGLLSFSQPCSIMLSSNSSQRESFWFPFSRNGFDFMKLVTKFFHQKTGWMRKRKMLGQFFRAFLELRKELKNYEK